MERITYPVARPLPALSVRRLAKEDAADVAALYREMGRDGAWCGEDTFRALLGRGAWWGGFADEVLTLCAALVPSAADTPQAAALRAALVPGRPPEWFLLPPAAPRQSAALAGELIVLLARTLCPHGVARAPAFYAALPVKAPAPLLAACFDAGLAAVRMRPLVSLRPHYLLTPRTAHGARQTEDAPRRVYLPLADTLAVSRLMERGFCATALLHSPADPRTLLCLEDDLS